MSISRTDARVFALLVSLGACSEPPFAHTNPIDPDFKGSYVLSGGPDTLSETLVQFKLQLEGTPPLSPTIRVSWASNHPQLHVDGRGYVFAEPTLKPAVGTITVTVGPHQARRSFVMLQRAASIVTTCRTFVRCDTVDALGAQFAFTVGGEDIYGRALLDVPFAMDEAPSIIRDPAVLALIVPIENDGRRRFESLANGTTWVTIDLGDFRDSVRVVVRQRATTWTNFCPETVAVGETSNLRARDFKDRNGYPLAVDVLGFPSIEWQPGQAVQAGASATVDPSGTITGVAAGRWLTSAVNPGFGSVDCIVTVVDP